MTRPSYALLAVSGAMLVLTLLAVLAVPVSAQLDSAGSPMNGSEPGPISGGGRPEVPDALQATTTLHSNSDAYVSSQNADSNYGTESRMNVGQRLSPINYGATRSLLWFDVSSVSKNQAVTDSRVRMFLREAGPLTDPARDVVLYRVKDSWPETNVTWNSFPSYDDSRLSGTSIGINVGNWFEWGGVTELVERARLPEWNHNYRRFDGLYIQGYESGGSYRAFDTREGTNRPELRVEHITDTTPPVSTMDALAQYTTHPTSGDKAELSLVWHGEDPSPYTGIDFFRLYARRNGGEWFLSGDNLRGYDIKYPADNGGIYEFAVHGVDPAGNVELTKSADTQTQVDFNAPTANAKPLPQYVTEPWMVNWEGVDHPTGHDMVASGIKYYNCYFRIDGGEWTPLVEGSTESGRIFDSPMIDNATYEFTVGAMDNAGHEEDAKSKQPQATTMLDRVAPTVSFGVVIGTDRKTFPVTWQGDDQGGSGVATYDIQFRRGLDPWQDWLINTTRTSEMFTGEFTNIYEFRGRARDAAGNQGAYPDEAQLIVGVVDPADLPNHISLPFSER